MKSRIFVLVVAIVMAFPLLFSSLVQAQPAIRDCTSTCSSFIEWAAVNATVYGAQMNIEVSNPDLSAWTNGVWDRYLVASKSGSGWLIIVGLEKLGNSGNGGVYCNGGTANTLYYFYHVGSTDNSYCTAVPSAQINHPATLIISNYVSNGGGQKITIIGYQDGSNMCYPASCVVSGNQNFDDIEEQEYLDNVSFYNHLVYGSYFTDNEWKNSAGAWSYQTTLNNHGFTDDPPQMYWDVTPPNSSIGGSLFVCDYELGSTCTYGS